MNGPVLDHSTVAMSAMRYPREYDEVVFIVLQKSEFSQWANCCPWENRIITISYVPRHCEPDRAKQSYKPLPICELFIRLLTCTERKYGVVAKNAPRNDEIVDLLQFNMFQFWICFR